MDQFSELAVAYLQRKQVFDQNSPAMDDLSKQISELEEQMWKHKNAVKTWGKRLAMNWMQRLVYSKSIEF